MKLIISGIGKRNFLIKIIKAQALNLNIQLVGCDSDSYPPARIEFEYFHKIRRAMEAGFIDSYLDVFDEEESVASITLIDTEIPVLGRIHRPGKVRVFHPNTQTALLCEDKYEFFKSARVNGISTLDTFTVPLSKYPFICKDRKGSAASGFSIIESEDDLKNLNLNRDLIFQPYCAGRHFCVDAYISFYSGELIDICIKEVLSKSKGESYLLKSINSDAVIDFVKNICRWLPLKGIINFDIYEDDNKLMLMEVNCRIGGNYPASHAFGCNLIKPFLEEVISAEASVPKLSIYSSNQIIAKYFSFSSPIIDDLI